MISPEQMGEWVVKDTREFLKENFGEGASLAKITGPVLADIVAHRFKWVLEQEQAVKADRKARANFVPPSAQEVEDFSRSINYPLNGEGWLAFYQTKDWQIQKGVRMKDWKAAVKKWKAMGWRLAAAAPRMTDTPDSMIEPGGWRDEFPESPHARNPWERIPVDVQRLIVQQMSKIRQERRATA